MDAISFHRCLVLLVRSEKLRVRVIQCLFLNGLIFLGSIMFFNFLISPILSKTDTILFWTEWMYYVLWIFPVYLLSFILNAFWYQDIASESIRIYPMKRPSVSSSLTGEIVEVIHRSIFSLCFLIFLVIIQRWRFIYLINLCWLIAYNAWEYRWIYFKKNSENKLKNFESNSIYYFFFGLPLALISFQFPSIIENGLISVSFPFLLMMASTANAPPGSTGRVRILILPEIMSKIFIFLLKFFST